MTHLLDTNVCIDALRGRREVLARLQEMAPEAFVVSVVTVFELFQGVDRAPTDRREREREKVQAFCDMIPCLPFDDSCGRLAAKINAALLNQGTPVGIADVWIAATAMVHGLSVVTSNVRDFDAIDGLLLENWRLPA